MHIFSIMHFLEKETEADTCMYESATGVVCKRGIFYGFLHFYFGLLELHIGGDVQCGFGAYSVAVTEVHPRIQTAEVFLAQCHTISQSDTCYRAVLLLQKGNTYRQLNRQKGIALPTHKLTNIPDATAQENTLAEHIMRADQQVCAEMPADSVCRNECSTACQFQKDGDFFGGSNGRNGVCLGLIENRNLVGYRQHIRTRILETRTGSVFEDNDFFVLKDNRSLHLRTGTQRQDLCLCADYT